MRTLSLISLIMGFVGLIASIVGFFWGDILLKSNDGFCMTITGKVAVVAILISSGAFLYAIWSESSQTRRDMSASYDEIARKFMIYPGLKTLIEPHFDKLKQLYDISNNYQKDPFSKNWFEKFVKFWFSHFVDPDINILCENYLNKFKVGVDLRLISDPDRMSGLRRFLELFWDSVNHGGTIRATSIVEPPPEGFWEQREAYLQMQKELIDKKGVHIYRYFIFVEDHKTKFNRCKPVLEDNINYGIKTRVTLFLNEKKAGALYCDMGIVDEIMGVENTIASGNIVAIECYTHPAQLGKNKDIKNAFIELDNPEITMKSEDYQNSEEFIAEVEKRISTLLGA